MSDTRTCACEGYRTMAIEARRALVHVKGIVSQVLDGDSLDQAEAMTLIEEAVDAALETVRPRMLQAQEERRKEAQHG